MSEVLYSQVHRCPWGGYVTNCKTKAEIFQVNPLILLSFLKIIHNIMNEKIPHFTLIFHIWLKMQTHLYKRAISWIQFSIYMNLTGKLNPCLEISPRKSHLNAEHPCTNSILCTLLAIVVAYWVKSSERGQITQKGEQLSSKFSSKHQFKNVKFIEKTI